MVSALLLHAPLYIGWAVNVWNQVKGGAGGGAHPSLTESCPPLKFIHL